MPVTLSTSRVWVNICGNSISLNELEKKFNVIIRHYPKEITKKMLTISRDVVGFSNLGKVHNEIYSSWKT